MGSIEALFLLCGMVYFVISLVMLAVIENKYGHYFFNPIKNYYEWKYLNVFGVLFFTLLINIVFAPFAIFYWILEILKFVFTVGRR